MSMRQILNTLCFMSPKSNKFVMARSICLTNANACEGKLSNKHFFYFTVLKNIGPGYKGESITHEELRVQKIFILKKKQKKPEMS